MVEGRSGGMGVDIISGNEVNVIDKTKTNKLHTIHSDKRLEDSFASSCAYHIKQRRADSGPDLRTSAIALANWGWGGCASEGNVRVSVCCLNVMLQSLNSAKHNSDRAKGNPKS